MDILIKHAKIVLIISFILFAIFIFQEFQSIQSNSLINIICFFLILSLGTSHGSLDHLKGEKIFQIFKIKNFFIFYITYILLASCIIILWFLFPTFTLIFFLIVACHHFGKEDIYFIIKKKESWHNLIFLSKGFLIILAPLLNHNKETIDIFLTLGADTFFVLQYMEGLGLGVRSNTLTLIYITIFGHVAFLFISVNNSKLKKENEQCYFLLDFIPICVLNSIFTPLIAFTLYFCFIHSFRHSVSLINLLDKNNFKNGFNKFTKKALPLTLITAILFIVTVYFLTNYYVLDDAILKIIFIGLASLTFPHILLEYLLEKNEK